MGVPEVYEWFMRVLNASFMIHTLPYARSMYFEMT